MAKIDLVKKDPFIAQLALLVNPHAHIHGKYSTNPKSIYAEFTNFKIRHFEGKDTDGVTLKGPGFSYIQNAVIDREGCNPATADELISNIHGGDVIFYRCRFRDNGKGYLQGSGDATPAELLSGQRSIFYECIFDSNSRRNPFIQVGQGYMIRCLVKDWGMNFHEKSYGCRAGSYGQLMVINSVFMQPTLKDCLRRWHFLRDTFCQMYLWHHKFRPGFALGAFADPGGHVMCYNCYANRPWIYLENHRDPMDMNEALLLVDELEVNVPY